MSDLVEFLRARIAEEYHNVQSLATDFVDAGDEDLWTQHSEAESRIVDLHSGPHICPGNAEHAAPTRGPYIGCDTIRLLAFDRRGNPGFRADWLPDELPRVIRTDAAAWSDDP